MPHRIALASLLLVAACEGRFVTPAPNSNQRVSGAMATKQTPIHRLTNDEYTNTVQDLLFTNARPGDNFPRSSVGESGYKNDSTALSVSQDWVARALTAADDLATAVIASKGTAGGAYAQIAPCASGAAGQACASDALAAFATRAYRRPIAAGSAEHAQLMAAFSAGATFDEGLHDAIVAALMSPRFLFVASEPSALDPALIDDYTLASRLAYFLWQTMPDEALLAAAASGALSTPNGLGAEVKRMLQDVKAVRFAKTLAREWAGLGNLESSSIAGVDDALRLAMLQETDLFLQDLLQSERSFIEVVRGDYSFVNKRLADLYGVTFPATDPASFQRVSLAGQKRMGIGTQASVLTVTAGAPDVTHPVRRGFWVVQRVMCMSPPPPPMDVPPLDPQSGAQSIRDRLNQHVASPACNGCHLVMDNVGLALENCGHGITDGNHNGGNFGFPLVLGGGKALGTKPGNFFVANNGDMSDLLFTISGMLGMGLANFQGSTKTLSV
ncbi:MAG: DUF1592 domain-containing protein [Deltaproteobacteria bacterium]|nr:DUF1592 domain-containing protein [Deltaproteobacteria bacterium]